MAINDLTCDRLVVRQTLEAGSGLQRASDEGADQSSSKNLVGFEITVLAESMQMVFYDDSDVSKIPISVHSGTIA